MLRGALDVGVVLLALGLASCGAATPSAAPVDDAPAPRDVGALWTLVPEGSTLLLLTEPSALFDAPASRRVIDAIVPAERLDRFSARTGVDPRTLTELVYAVHPDGQVVLARGPVDAAFAVREAGERMAPVESSVDEPFVRRVGFLGSQRVDLAAIAPNTIAWVAGTPQLAAGVLAAADLDEDERDHAFRGHTAELRRELSPAPFAVFAPEPLDLPRDTGVGMLMAREEALAATARPHETGDGALSVRAELRGEFPPGAHENFRALARSIAESDLGAAIGARDALPSLRVEAEDDRVAMSAELPADVLAAGLRMLLVAEIDELLELGRERVDETGGGEGSSNRPFESNAVAR